MRYVFPQGECQGQTFGVKVKRITEWSLVVDNARYTIHKKELGKEPSEEFKRSMALAEHSPVRCLRYIIELTDVPCWVSQHIARHDAFAGHTMRDGAEDTQFVATSRTDRFQYDENKKVERSRLPQDAPVCHRIFLDAQDFIIISKLRLCNCASYETRFVWQKIIEELSSIDKELASKCVRMCVYRGFCPEIKKCGYDKTAKFQEELYIYRNK